MKTIHQFGLLKKGNTMARKQKTNATKNQPGNGLHEMELFYESSSATEVHVSGDFNNWSFDALPMVRDKRGVWRTRVALPGGRYEYRFIVDGDWQNDPNACGVVPNEFGSCNCVLEVTL